MLDESLQDFHDCFVHYYFGFLEDEVDWEFTEIFQYLVHFSKTPHELESFEPIPTYLSVRAPKSETHKVFVTSDPPSPSHQIALAPQVKVGEVENPPIDLLPSPPT